MSLPLPCGWRILVEVTPDEKIAELVNRANTSGLALPDSFIDEQVNASTTGSALCRVLAKGEDCYTVRFNTKQWCEVGDKILIINYAGMKLRDPDQPDKLFRIINDEDVVAVYRDRG